MGGVADKEAYTVHIINIISQRQCFVARCLSSCVSNVLVYIVLFVVRFPSTLKLVT
jgi:hypothetical protein